MNRNQIHQMFEEVLKNRKKQRISEQLKVILSEDIGPSVPGQDMNANIGGAPAFGFSPAQLSMGSLSSYKIPLDLKDRLFKIIQTTPLRDTMAKIDMVANFIQQMELQQQMEAEMQNDTGDLDSEEQAMEGGEMPPEEGEEMPPEDGEEMPEESEESDSEDQEDDIDSEDDFPPKKKKKKE